MLVEFDSNEKFISSLGEGRQVDRAEKLPTPPEASAPWS